MLYLLTFNDDNIIKNYDIDNIDLTNCAAINGIDESIFYDGLECNDEYLTFQRSILSIMEPSANKNVGDQS